MRQAQPQTIIAIDLLRFCAALLVVAYHIDAAYWLAPSPHAAPLLAPFAGLTRGNPVSRVGWIGVEIFFVVSGLVIGASARNGDWRDFLARRARRLVPAAWVCATVTLAVLVSTGLCTPGILVPWLRSMLFWPTGEQIDNSYWTLGVECFFYLMVAATIGDGRRPGRLRWLACAIGMTSGAGWLATWCWPNAMLPIMANQTATLLLLPYGVFFSIGMVLADCTGRRPRMGETALLAILVMAAMIEIDAHAQGRASQLGVAMSTPIAQALFAGALALIAGARRLQVPLSRMIAPGTARTVGLMTYPLYLLHQDAGAVLIARLLRADLPLWAAEAATIGVMIALAWAVAVHAEPALRAALGRAIRPRRGRAPDNRPTAFPSAG